MDLRRPAGALFEMSFVAAVIAWPSGWRSASTTSRPPGPARLADHARADLQVVGWLLITFSLPRLPAALMSISSRSSRSRSVGLGAILLGQEPSALQLCGVTFILAA